MPSAAAPTFAYGAAAGTSPPTLVGGGTGIPTGSIPTDDDGVIQFGTGTATTTGVLGTVTLGGNYSSGVVGLSAGMRFQVWPMNTATAALGIYISATNNRQIQVSCTTAPTASQANTVYQFGYRT